MAEQAWDFVLSDQKQGLWLAAWDALAPSADIESPAIECGVGFFQVVASLERVSNPSGGPADFNLQTRGTPDTAAAWNTVRVVGGTASVVLDYSYFDSIGATLTPGSRPDFGHMYAPTGCHGGFRVRNVANGATGGSVANVQIMVRRIAAF